jgi:hypothetical protein
MRFMVIRQGDEETEAGTLPSEALIRAMGDYVEEMVNAGVMRMGEGLKPTSAGARVLFTDGKPRVVDGPFTEAKELIAGVSIIEVASKAEAIEWLKRWPVEDAGGNARLELREMYELADFGDSEGVEQHARLQERMGPR